MPYMMSEGRSEVRETQMEKAGARRNVGMEDCRNVAIEEYRIRGILE